MEERVRKELLSLAAPTRSESGCINYDLDQAIDDKSLFLFYENWVSKDDLGTHLEMPYLEAFMEKAEDILAEPVEITFWEMIS